MVDKKKDEINADIIRNADMILAILKDWEPSNDTPPGRIIFECRWLKQEIAANQLTYPEAYEHITSIRHTYVADDMLVEHYEQGIELYFANIISLCSNELLIKPPYYPMTITLIDALIHLLHHASRPLTINESRLDDELEQLKTLLAAGKIEPPLMSYLPDYFNFRGVYRINKSSLDDQPNGKYLVKTVANLIFEGVRPDTWLTPDEAEKDVAQYIS